MLSFLCSFFFLLLLLCATCKAQTSTPSSITDDIKTYEIELPINLSGTTSNWRIWYPRPLSTRLFPGMDSDKNIYIGCTSSDNHGYVFKVDPCENKIISKFKFSNHHIRGLYVHQDGSYGALLWNPKKYNIYIAKVNNKNKQVWRTELKHSYAKPDDFNIGDSRLEYGNGEYRAYYHVHGVKDNFKGHEGDAYFSVDDSGKMKMIWGWGCSHSMSNLLRFHPETNKTVAICDSDAYPGLGIFTEDRNLIYNAPGNMGGSTAAELGGVEIGNNGTWLLVFNALQPERNNATYGVSGDNQDIGLAFIGSDKQKISVKFFTKTENIDEEDSCIARIDNGTNYLVGWKANNDYLLSIIDSDGNFVEEPTNVTDFTMWGTRDDSFRAYDDDGSVIWLYAPDNKGNKVVITRFREDKSKFVCPKSGSGIVTPLVYLLVAVLLFLF